MPEIRTEILEEQLNDFDPEIRSTALAQLSEKAMNGEITIQPEREVANMHCHTFFSFNGYGYSPAAIAWLAKKNGIKLIGSVDFDVLDAVDEFLKATDLLGIRASCGVETRVFIPEFHTREINSPGEPGVSYHMGIGFSSNSVPQSSVGILNDLRERATKRNLVMLSRLNAHLDPIKVDYERDVLSLTPNGYATERHMLSALINVVNKEVADKVLFWSEKLNLPFSDVEKSMQDVPKFSNLVRSKLMKRGGVGYIEPDAGSFPKVEEFHQLITDANALPCITWLDGTSEGEKAIQELADLLIKKGAVALNIVPDRNWNIADPKVKEIKVRNLYQVVELARDLDLPINMGTEMNSFGQKLVDDFDAPELEPVKDDFIDGAYFIYGHTLMERAIRKGYQSEWAQKHLVSRKAKNHFYNKLGRCVQPGVKSLETLKTLDNDHLTPDDVLSHI